jgi:N6-adenosine-specific RNA methylase IME4
MSASRISRNHADARKTVEAAKKDSPALLAVGGIIVPPNRLRGLRPEKVAEIAESISNQGLLQPIVVRRPSDGLMLVAGWHRLEATKLLGHKNIRASVRDINADEARLIEIDENLARADLSPAERALNIGARKVLYERLHPETKHGATGRSGYKEKIPTLGSFAETTAKATRQSRTKVARDATRAKHIVVLPDIVGTSLDQGDELDALAKLPEDEQRRLAARAKAGEKVQVKIAVRKMQRDRRVQELATATENASRQLGTALYTVIYADCPWKYDNVPMGDVARAIEEHYPTMELEDICKLPTPAARDCCLFLWATIPLLEKAFTVMNAWGFRYRSAIAWKKDKTGIGYWTRSQLEILLIGTRGDIPTPAPGDQLPAIIEAPRGRHSEKPEVFAQHIERLFPNVPKLEMFARKARPGWDAWGNEAPPAEAAE